MRTNKKISLIFDTEPVGVFFSHKVSLAGFCVLNNSCFTVHKIVNKNVNNLYIFLTEILKNTVNKIVTYLKNFAVNPFNFVELHLELIYICISCWHSSVGRAVDL